MITDSEAKPNTADDIERQAAAATATAQQLIDAARIALDQAETLNALGIFIRREATLGQLGAAMKAIKSAMETIANSPWPAERVYEATDQ